ncbi:Uncharacterized protein APZ42_029706 [Daphnia magna]|uniref:Uncharacterized protein n=1 Tax=Daphnia magna TaxID=35525 RepID=A0A164PDS6_9CRUS|nr:Uncharacterized protein APZ42_029706 [Daphnia magna]
MALSAIPGTCHSPLFRFFLILFLRFVYVIRCVCIRGNNTLKSARLENSNGTKSKEMMVVKLIPRNRPKSNIGIDFRDCSRQAMK